MLTDQQKERIRSILVEAGNNDRFDEMLAKIEKGPKYGTNFDPRSNMVFLTDTVFYYLGNLYENYKCSDDEKPCNVCCVKQLCENAETEEYLMLCCAEFDSTSRWTIRQIPW